MELLRITRQIHCKAVEQRATLIHIRQYNRDWGTSYSRPPLDPYLTSPPLLQNPGGATAGAYLAAASNALHLDVADAQARHAAPDATEDEAGELEAAQRRQRHGENDRRAAVAPVLRLRVHLYPHTHTHTRARLTALFPGLSGWAGTRKVKPIWILLKQGTVSGSGISRAVCKSAPRSRQITTPTPHHSFIYMPDALPAAQPTAPKQ